MEGIPATGHDWETGSVQVTVTDVLAYSAMETTGYEEHFECSTSGNDGYFCDGEFATLEEIVEHKASLISQYRSSTGIHDGILLVREPVTSLVTAPAETHTETVEYQECRICGEIQHEHQYGTYYEKVKVIDKATGTSAPVVTDAGERFPDYPGVTGTDGIILFVCQGGADNNCYSAFLTTAALSGHMDLNQPDADGVYHDSYVTASFTVSEQNTEESHYELVAAGTECIFCGDDR